MANKKKDWKKQNQAYKLGEPGSPLSPHAVTPPVNQDTPILASIYGTFSAEVLSWIDSQPVIDGFISGPDKDIRIALSSLRPIREPQQAKELRKERSEIIAARRSRFNKNRDQLMLAMLHSGMAYICNHNSCGEMRNLHVDHKIPLSKGGSDDLQNLQFLCPKHNAEKGDRYQN